MPRKPKTEKIDAKELAKKLLIDKTHGAAKAGAKELEKADKFSVGYKKFLDLSKTERETVTGPGRRSTTTTGARPSAWRSSAKRAARTGCASPPPTSTAPGWT